MVPIELVDEVTAHHLGVHDPLLDEAREAAPDAHLRAAGHLAGDFPGCQGLPALRQHSKNRPV
jgi:hypothetical protein